jgi:predicted phosphodiesterase
MTNRGRASVLFAFAIMAVACAPAGQSPAPLRGFDSATLSVVVFSDLHFDPLTDTTLVDSLARADVARWRTILDRSTQKAFSQYGSDTNYPLLVSTLAAMQRTESAPDIVLFAGDFMAHHFQANFRKFARDTSAAALAGFVNKTSQFVAQQLVATFPGAQILPTLGNNDSVCGDYMTEPESEFLRSVAEAWQPLVNRHGNSPDFVQSFSRAGHYSATVPVRGMRVVVLNDVYLSTRYSNACGSAAATPGRDALAWLERVLTESQLRRERVWLLTHIPVGVDVFATVRGDTLVNMLDPRYGSALTDLLRRFGTTVRYGIYGHTHMNDFRLIADADGTPLIGSQGIPAVSPMYGNDPAFVVMSIDSASGAIDDYTMYTLKNLAIAGSTAPAVWSQEYDFDDVFGGGWLSAATFARVHRSIASDASVRANYILYHDAGSGRASISSSWRAYWCGIDNVDPAAFMRCYRAPK